MVKEAEHIETGQHYACKIIYKRLANPEESKVRSLFLLTVVLNAYVDKDSKRERYIEARCKR